MNRHVVVIGITTKNRQSDLELTVNRLHELGYSFPLMIVDDGSTVPVSLEGLPNSNLITLIRYKESAGLIERRNSMVRNCNADYFISLDDDSCFKHKYDFADCVSRFENDPSLGAIAFNLLEAGQSSYPIEEEPRDMAMYRGGAHILRVSDFLELGGYKPFLVYGSEEQDYGMRLFAAGKRIISMPSIIVEHRKTTHGRPTDRYWFYRSRNAVLVWVLNLPLWLAALRSVFTVLSLFQFLVKNRQASFWRVCLTFRGVLSGLHVGVRHRLDGRKMRARQFYLWNRLRQRQFTR